MTKVLGIDTGTNSLGWAIVERTDEGNRLIEKGVSIFQEGVKVEKGIESSKAAERTGHRALRVQYYRRKLRKIRLLRILSDHHLCPPLSPSDLSQWRLHKRYPQSELLMQWQRTDDLLGVNPYSYRHRCLHERLDLSDTAQRYILGRALYHICQRRGFLSNRKDQDSDEETGKVKEGIGQLSEAMEAAGCEYLGDYLYILYGRGERIRRRYTARKEHYLREFRAICAMQQLDDDLVQRLEKAIFYQRPLKSQKGLVGRCVFEKKKPKCPTSHPLFEEYRMLCFVNNIRIQKDTVFDHDLRPLNAQERALIAPLFYRKSKRTFPFEDIAKKIAGRATHAFLKDKKAAQAAYRFNYPMDYSVAGSPVTAQLIDLFGEQWEQAICEVYIPTHDTPGRTSQQIVGDVWHALFAYDDADKLALWAQRHLQLNDEESKRFAAIKLPGDYAALSLKAINGILPYLRQGLIYSHAVFLANLSAVLPAYEWDNPLMRQAAIDNLIEQMNEYVPASGFNTLEDYLKDYLRNRYHVGDDALQRLYHPSMIDVYPRQRPDKNGLYQLGSPRIVSVRNPMAMRSLFALRHLVNRLLSEGKIDRETVINIEFARELNDANRRKALSDSNRRNEKNREEARTKITDLYRKQTGQTLIPTDTDILKYQLWEEQEHLCLYTGREIGLTEFLGPNPTYDIEHTVPQSVGGDSTRMNLTLCDARFNREVKRAQLPSQLANHEDILRRIEGWKDRYEQLDRQIRRLKRAGGYEDKPKKDRRIQNKHLLTLERDYWRGKYERFTMTQVPEGFSRRQGTDISVISRYARLFLKSVFPKVFIVKGIATSDFRKIWGLQDLYAKKERVNHVHHCIDAIVIACIGPGEYADLARYYHDDEQHRWYGHSKAQFLLPWPTFVEDVKGVEEEILVAHHTSDNMRKQGRRRIMLGARKVLSQGDAARGSLHNDTYYGAIAPDGGEQVRYVVRRPLDTLKESDIKNIVDATVRGIIEQAIAEKGFAQAMSETIWMNEQKRIPIRKVRCYAVTVTNPLHIRQQRDLSDKEYKRQFHVANDRNYLMAIYIGQNAKGKEKRDFELITMLQAAEYYKRSNDTSAAGGDLVPSFSKHGYPLAYLLKIGTLVLLYEKTPDEIREANYEELSRRLYKVRGLSSMVIQGNPYAIINMVHHEEARPSNETKAKNGAYKQGETLRPAILMLHTQIRALVEGYDFRLNEIGEIEYLR